MNNWHTLQDRIKMEKRYKEEGVSKNDPSPSKFFGNAIRAVSNKSALPSKILQLKVTYAISTATHPIFHVEIDIGVE